MVRFQINDTHYETPDGWDKITFGKFLKSLDKIEPQRPEALTSFMDNHFEAIGKIKDSLSKAAKEYEAVRLFEKRWSDMIPTDKLICYKFFEITIAYWCDVDIALLHEAMNREQLEQTYWVLEYEMNPNNAKPSKDFAGFEINGIEYLPPKKHMEGSTVVEFAESAYFQESMQKVAGGNWIAMGDVMVVLCRPKGEAYEYDEQKHNRRKALFMGLTMDKVIDVAFFLLKLNDTLNDNLLIYTLEVEKQRKEVRLLENDMGGLE